MLKENYDSQGKAGALVSYPVAEKTHIFKGALVCINCSGYAVPGADAEGFVFVGVAYEECNNETGDNGDRRVRVLKTGSFLYWKKNALQSNMGASMFIFDDDTLSFNANHSIVAGYVVEVPSGEHVRIRVDGVVR